jgi:hypothetical protein
MKTKKIEISMKTRKKIKDQLEDEVIEINELDDYIGQKLFIRTVTYHFLGKVKKRIGNIFMLEDASWVADSGRFMQFIKDGDLKDAEIEPLGDWFVNLETATDFGIWKHDLPVNQK